MSAPILYVEDEEDYQILVRRILQKVGLEISVADTGAQGLQALEQQKPRLLILDINLPDTDGYSLCGMLRQKPEWKNIPIVMLTVRRRPDEWARGFSAGADDYVPKPLNPPDLVERIQACLDGNSRRAQAPAGGEFGLIQAAISGNRAAFEVLVQQYRDRLIDTMRPFCQRGIDVEDLTSIAFLQAYKSLEQFRGQSSFYTWLYRIAMRESYRLARRSPSLSLEELTHGDEVRLATTAPEPNPVEEHFVRDGRRSQIARAVSIVPRPYRQMLQLHFVRGMSYQRMARRLKIPEGTVMSRLFKARQLLRDAWELSSK